jgi:TPR repeat protein
MSPIRRIASADFLMVLVAAVFFSGCGESTTSPPVAQEAAKVSPEQELAALTRKAEAGDAEAQFKLGVMHDRGVGVPKNVAKAIEWIQKAAVQGNTEAQHNLGLMYYEGTAVTKDPLKSLEWFQKAADKGYPPAQFRLGLIYKKGEGVKADIGKAVELWEKAAVQGYANAQFALGLNYFLGEAGSKDTAKAYYWYQKAADQGFVAAQDSLGTMYSLGIGVPKDATKALYWFDKAASQGDSGAQFNLGLQYLRGDGVPKDAVLAYAWLNLAAALGTEATKQMASEYRYMAEKLMSSEDLAEAQQISSGWKKGQTIVRHGGKLAAGPTQAGVLTKKGTGTSFVVGKTGHAVTNQHVTSGCTELRIQGRDGLAKLITEDLVNDLTLVQIPGAVTDTAAIAAEPTKLRQGEDIVVFGFPLNSVLSSGGNLTPGVVSAMTGLGNNTNQIQITAPIQPGSSGSPVLNKKGEVVGVVSMKLSDSKMAKATGSIGQNVNFAVSGQTLKTFLDTHKVEYRTGGVLSFSKNTADLADEARKWTLVVECWK